MATIGEQVQSQLDAHARRLGDLAPLAVLDEPDAVHQLRVTTRRIRSLLRVFRDCFVPESLDHLRSELDWLGESLGQARDIEVLQGLIGPEADGTPLAGLLEALHQQAMANVVEALKSGRFTDLIDTCLLVATDPPFAEAAQRRERDVVRELLRKERRRVAKQVTRERRAALAGDGDDEEALHEVRKTARRGRYSAEACGGVRAWYTARRMEHLQDLLGSHRDAVLSVAIIDEFPDAALDAARQRLTDKAARKLHQYERLARHRAYRAAVKEKQGYAVQKPDDQWRATLSAEEYRVLREAGTERPFSHAYETDETAAVYECRACGSELFRSETKFDAHCGWPAFYAPLADDRVEYVEDRSYGSVRTEVRCASCGSHLGHMFEGEGFDTPTDQRYCINGVALRQVPDA